MSSPAFLTTTAQARVPHASQSARSHEAIARAAERTGADFGYLLAQARLESSLDPDARARTSSAAGLYQFIDSTWLETLDRHGASFGFAGASAAIERQGGRARVIDPSLSQAIMGLRFDAEASALMAGALAEDNRATLAPLLGRNPDPAELYLAHFLGAGGATKFLTALAADPDAPAAALFPAPAAANRSIFYGSGGAPRSLAGVMELFRGKMATAMGEEGLPFSPAPTANGFARAQAQWHQASSAMTRTADQLDPAGHAWRPSMAETLRTSFALDAASSQDGGGNVRSAYGKLKALGL